MTAQAGPLSAGWRQRLWSPKAAALLGRNTVVSVAVFGIGLLVLWLLVEFAHVGKLEGAAATFLLATSLHYVAGRLWIYRGTDRAVLSGYGIFLINAVVGLVITMALFWALIHYTAIHYLVARALVSVVAGLVMFLLNAVLNFRRL